MSQIPLVTQRWRERRDSYRPAREPIEGPFTRVRHPGNLVYAFGLDKRTRAALPPGLPYPKAIAAPPAVLARIA